MKIKEQKTNRKDIMKENDIKNITNMIIESIKNSEMSKQNSKGIPVGVSARHIHLTADAVARLYGQGYQLTKKKELMGGQYACNETVAVISHKMKILEHIRVIGPVRNQSQLEISATDAFKFGVDAPVRNSGDTKGSASITLVGPMGSVTLEEGCIIAARHIHMSSSDARNFNVIDNEMVSVKYEGIRATTFHNVLVRVGDSYSLEMHIDTDEANAAGIKTGNLMNLIKS